MEGVGLEGRGDGGGSGVGLGGRDDGLGRRGLGSVRDGSLV